MVRYIVPRVIIILKISKLKKFQIADYSYPSSEYRSRSITIARGWRTLEEIQMRVRTTRRIVRNQEFGGRKRRGEGGEGRRAERSRLLYYQGIKTCPIMSRSCETQWSCQAELCVERRWMEGLVRSLRDYGTGDGPPKIDRTDYVLDDFKPILNAAILLLRPPRLDPVHRAIPRADFLFFLALVYFIFSLLLFSFFETSRTREDSGSGFP